MLSKTEYDKIIKDIKHSTQKIANEVYIKRLDIILKELQEKGIHIDDNKKSIKKGRPRKDF